MSASVDWEFWKDSAWQLSLRVFHVVAILSWLGLQSYEDRAIQSAPKMVLSHARDAAIGRKGDT